MIGEHNQVKGCYGWHYGLMVTHDDGSVTFTVYGPQGARIENIVASPYRTTRTARMMRSKLPGYQHAAQQAIKAMLLRESGRRSTTAFGETWAQRERRVKP